MSRLLPLLCLVLVLGGPRPAEAAPTTVELAAGANVGDLSLALVSKDRVVDLLLLDGRTVRIWRGREGKLPAPEPTWAVDLGDGVSFVDPAPPLGPPTLLTLGREGLLARKLPSEQGGALTTLSTKEAASLGWRDQEGARFAGIAREQGLLVPRPDGWVLEPWSGPGDTVRLPVARHRTVSAPGPFLEDTCAVLAALPEAVVGTPPTAGAKGLALWAIDGQALIGQSKAGRVAYDLSFLSAESGATFDQTLVDLDGDGRPDVLHRIHTNRETRYGFFHTKPAAEGAERGPAHMPAASALFLSGFQLEPDLVDLDGDGLKDLVVTSMQINAPNMLGALTSGRVTAETRAFLNRWRDGEGSFFRTEPDAVVKSQIGVKVQFNYAGNIEVVRSFTILLAGDYDGDGRKDLAIRTAPDTLTIRRGVGEGVWANDQAAVDVKIPPKGRHPDVDGYTADLDADGRDEIVLVYRKPDGGKDRVWIVDPGL